jgi:nicotinamidase-related amidase
MATLDRLDARRAQLLVIDLQEKLLRHIADHESVIAQSARMCRAAQALSLPLTLTEQYRRGLGPTPEVVLTAAEEAARFEKMTFSAWQDEATRARLQALDRPQVLLVGIEAHVCVQQTALDLLAAGIQPFVLADGVGSRRLIDCQTALSRLRVAGAVITTVEAAIFEMLDRAGTELFKRILPIVR